MKSDENIEKRHSSDRTALTIPPCRETSLAGLPFFLLDDEDRRRKQGLSYETTLTTGGREELFQWQVSADPSFGFPDSFDRKVFKILEYLALQNGLPLKNPIHFSLYKILQIIDLPPFGVHFARVRSSLQRIAAVKIHAHIVRPGEKKAEHQAQTFHLYDEVTFQEESFGHEIGAGNHLVTFGAWYLEHLNQRLIPPVDIPYFQLLQNPVASRLYELLSLEFEEVFRQKQKGWEVTYPRLCRLLPLREAGWMSSPQRHLEEAHDELIAGGFVDRAEWSKGDEGWTVLYVPGEQARTAFQAVPEARTAEIAAPAKEKTDAEEIDKKVEAASIPGNPEDQDLETTHAEEEGKPDAVAEEETSRKAPVAARDPVEETKEADKDREAGREAIQPEERAPEAGEEPTSPEAEASELAPRPEDVDTEKHGGIEEDAGFEPAPDDPHPEETGEGPVPVGAASPPGRGFLSRGVAMFDDQNGQHAVCDIRYHVAWMTKSRDQILNNSIALRTREVLRDVCTVREVKILQGVIAPDHVHLQVSCPPTVSPSDLVNDLKARTSQKLQEEFPALQQRYWGHSLWAGSYLCITFGDMAEEDLTRYLDTRKPEEAGDESFQVVPAP